MTVRKACFLLLLFFPLSLSSDFKLSDSKILLPYYSILPLNFTLKGSDSSCYKWTSGAPEVVTVTPVINETSKQDCSQQVVVSAVWKSPHRATTTVFAENKYTGHIIKCDVIVDKITRLEIATTTHELFLHDAPEALEIKAFDEFGNTFSSLDGIPFEWRIFSTVGNAGSSDAPQVEGHQILRFISYTESEYATPAHIADLEAQGMQGYIQLVSGLKTGSARVSVSVKPSIYAGVKSGEVKLLVMANSVLSPALVYAIPLAHVKYHVHVVQQGNVIEIDMPSPQYYLELNSTQPGIATLDPESACVTAQKLGNAEVTLHDRNIQEEFRKPSSLLHVVEPGYLMFVVHPGKRWILETGRRYVVNVHIFDYNSHRIHPSDNLRLKVVFPGQFFRVLASTANGTQHLVETLKAGSTSLQGELATLETPDGKIHRLPTPVVGSQEVEIYRPIDVIPPLVVLPDHPSLRKPGGSDDRFQLKARGGSGEYLWSVPGEGHRVVNINARGELTVQGRGHTKVFASDVRNAENRGSGDVFVTPVAGLAFMASRVEAEIGAADWLLLPLSTTDAEGRPMRHCHRLPIAVGVEDASVIEVDKRVLPNPNTTSPACALVRIRGIKVGFTEVTARYETLEGRVETLSARVMVGAYHPLRYQPHFHLPTMAVASLGATLTVSLTGGPQPWILNPARYFSALKNRIEAGDGPVTEIKPLGRDRGGPGSHLAFDVRCLRLGKVRLNAAVGNEATSKNAFPVVARAGIDLVCALPAVLHIVPLLRLPKGNLPPCPIVNDTTQQRPIHNDLPLEVDLHVVDGEGRRLDQCDSLDIRLSTSAFKVLRVPPAIVFQAGPDRRPAPVRFTATPGGYPAAVTLTAKTSALRTPVRGVPNSFVEIRSELFLVTVERTQVSPPHLRLFDHADSSAKARIVHGSGHFAVLPAAAVHSHVRVVHHLRQLDVHVARAKELDRSRDAVFAVHDLCLEPPADLGSPALRVTVQSLHRLVLTYVDKIQLGKEARFSVQALDHAGQPIPAHFFSKMKLEPVLGSAESGRKLTLSVLGTEKTKDSLFLLAAGVALGVERLVVQGLGRMGNVIQSNEAAVQVYPPLALVPPDVTLLKGASFQLMTEGGPQPLGGLDFVAEGHEPATRHGAGGVSKVRRAGLVTGLHEGVTRVEARAAGGSSAKGVVRVVLLRGVRVFAPLTVVEAGAVLPVWATGAGGAGENPLAMGSLQPHFEFHWGLSSEQVARLQHVLAPAGVAVEKKHQSSGMRLVALAPGEVTVRLRVAPSDPAAAQVADGALLHAQLTVKIIAPIALLHPPKARQRLLITPATQVNLRSNRDSLANMDYRLLDDRKCPGSAAALSGSSVSADGRLSTSGTRHITVLQVTSREALEDVNQTLTLLVDVKPISYMMLSLRDPAHKGQGQTSYVTDVLPIGGPYPFVVSFHDDLGAEFDVTNAKVNYRLNRFEYLQLSRLASNDADNASLAMRVSDPGSTVIRVHSGDLQDFVTVPTGHVISPSDLAVTIGDVVCFQSPFTTAGVTKANNASAPGGATESIRGSSWISSNNDMLAVDAASGIAVATGVGATSVRQQRLHLPQWPTETTARLSVLPAARLHLRPVGREGGTALALLARKPALFAIETAAVGGAMQGCEADGAPGSSDKLRGWASELVSSVFACEAEFVPDAPSGRQLFRVSAELDPRLGPVCAVRPAASAEEAASVSSLELDLLLRVRLHASHGQAGLTSAPLRLPVTAGFRILTEGWPEGGGAAPDRLSLTANDQQPFLLRIAATKRAVQSGLRVESSCPRLIQLLPTQHDARNPNVLIIPIRGKALPAPGEPSPTIVVEHALTGQRQVLHVLLRPGGGPASGPRRERPVEVLAALLLSPLFLYTIIIALGIVILINICNSSTHRPRHDAPIRPLESPVKMTPLRQVDGLSGQRQRTPEHLGATSSPPLWSRGYRFSEPAADFRPLSPYRRSPHSMTTSFSS